MADTIDAAILADLEAMASDLHAAARRLHRDRWNVAPAAGGFSLVEQAWHLADLEREGYGERIRRLLAEEDPLLADFDGARLARERSYRTKPLQEGIAAFAAARAGNVALLRSLASDAWDRRGRQEGVGPVALGDIPRMMREHDDTHRAEIAALLAGTPIDPVRGSIDLRALQAPLKERYRADGAAAVITLRASGRIAAETVTCRVATGRALVEAGLHPATGGTGLAACSGDMLLEALVACAGVTCGAVATSMGIALGDSTISAEGDIDFRGTLGVAKDVPVGFRGIRLRFHFVTEAPAEQVAKLVELTERYCVVYKTLLQSPPLSVDHTLARAGEGQSKEAGPKTQGNGI